LDRLADFYVLVNFLLNVAEFLLLNEFLMKLLLQVSILSLFLLANNVTDIL